MRTRLGHDQDCDAVRRARRRRASAFALLLFVLGVAAAPVLDGWLHAGVGGGAAAAPDAGDCVVHQLAATQLVLTAAAPVLGVARSDAHPEVLLAPRAPHAARGDRLIPPSRAPPA